MATVNEAVARPVRTVTQGVIAGAILEVVDTTIWNMPERTYAAFLVLLTALVGAIQVTAENHYQWAFLRQLQPPKTPVIDEGPKDDDKYTTD